MPHLIGLAPLTVLELAPPDMVSCAATAGFDFVGLRLLAATPHEVQHQMVGDTPAVRETAARLRDTGLRCLDIEIFRLRPDTDVQDYEAALATGARLGATQALVAGNDPVESRLVERFGRFCELAARHGIGANLEPMPWTDCKRFSDGLRIVTRAGQPNGGVLIDPIHFDRAGSRLCEVAAAPRHVFRYMQLCDAPAERPVEIEGLLHQARAERLMPGDGQLPLRELLASLPGDLPLSLEIPMVSLSSTLPAEQRVARMLQKTRRLIGQLA